jgi:putative sigma-54 modulation protein
MEIIVSGRNHLEITPAIRQYATDKLGRLPRFFDRIQKIDVVAGRHDSHSHEVEVIVTAEHASPFIARDSGGDLYACIDNVISKLERQLTDHKSKIRDRKH